MKYNLAATLFELGIIKKEDYEFYYQLLNGIKLRNIGNREDTGIRTSDSPTEKNWVYPISTSRGDLYYRTHEENGELKDGNITRYRSIEGTLLELNNQKFLIPAIEVSVENKKILNMLLLILKKVLI